jgi:phage tail-like protein
MDRAPHFLMNGLAGWRAATMDHTVFADGGDVLSLQPLPGSVRPLVDALGTFGGLQAAIGVAVDSQDRIYVLDGAACVIKRYDRCSQSFATLPCIGGCGSKPRELDDPRGMAISCRDDLYLCDSGNYRVQVFSIKGLALRAIWGPLVVNSSAHGYLIQPAPHSYAPGSGPDCQLLRSFPEGTWQPWDAVTTAKWIYVSDYANGLIHVFDWCGCWRTAYDGAAAAQPPLSNPTRIAVDLEGRIYVLQEGKDYVVVLDEHGAFAGIIKQPDEVPGKFCPVAVAVDVNGDLCLSDCITRKIYFYRPDNAGGWCTFRCCGSQPAFAASLVFDLSGNPLFTDGAQSVCLLEPPASYPSSGTYVAGPLDSRTYRCLWHRVVLRGTLPLGCSVRADTFTSESVKSIDEILGLPESRWATGQLDTSPGCGDWDCLLLSAPGRYLWLRLTLAGDGTATPEITRAKVYYPRASALRYLPSVYREDPISEDFLDRFLSLFDTIRALTADQVTDIAHYFDPKATPANPRNDPPTDFLSWLASWLGMTLQMNWPVHKRRELVRQAHRLYALRGTPEGLRLHIELFAGVRPTILELFQLRRWLIVGQSSLGNCSSVFGDDVLRRLHIGSNSSIGKFQLLDNGDPRFDLFNEYAYQFQVFVPRWPGAQESDRQTLEAIIEMAKPAHTEAQLQWNDPRFRIGIQSFVGVDTVIGRYPEGVIEGQGKLGYDTVLGDPGVDGKRPSLAVGRNTRLGNSMLLN